MNIKIHIVAPYESMISIINECIPLFPELSIDYSVGDLEQGVVKATEAENQGADIIVSRGGTARLIKKAVSIPVIDLKLSGYDMIRSLMLASNLQEKTAIVGFANVTSGAQAIIDLLDLPLKAFTVTDSDEVPPLILDLKNRQYKQIAGDVITLRTANAYGLKGFLIQSGKESMMRALEDAKLIYGYLHRNDFLTHIFEHAMLSEYPNVMVLNGHSRPVYEKWTEFGQNPLTNEQLAVLNSELQAGQDRVSVKLKVNGCILQTEGHSVPVKDETYYLLTLRKQELTLPGANGTKVRSPGSGEPLADASPAIRLLLDRMRGLHLAGEPVYLQGAKGTGKAFIAEYMHRELAADGMLLTLDLNQLDIKDAADIPLESISTVKLVHPEQWPDYGWLRSFVKRCSRLGIRIYMLGERPPSDRLLEATGAGLLMMPSLQERQEDLSPLAHFFLSACHQKYGTTAVKIQAEALQLLLDRAGPGTVEDLKELIKQVALNEPEYVIRPQTVGKVLSKLPPLPQWHNLNGTLKDIEQAVIQAVLEEENYNQSRTAERLGINRATLWRKLKG